MLAPRVIYRKDDGVSAVLGTVLMLAIMMTLVPGLLTMRQAWSDVSEAQIDAAKAERESAELAAFCARNPDVADPRCDRFKFAPGYECEAVPPIGGKPALVCVKNELELPAPPSIS